MENKTQIDLTHTKVGDKKLSDFYFLFFYVVILIDFTIFYTLVLLFNPF